MNGQDSDLEEGSQLLHPGRGRLQARSHSQWITVLQLTTPTLARSRRRQTTLLL